MTLKEATTNSLLMFVAATCVVLIVKAMPSTQATVQAVAGSNSGTNGPAAQNSSTGTPTLAMRDGVKVYYLHGNTRCPTCRTIEANAQDAVQVGFADELKSGKIQWQVINYESPGNAHYATDYEVVAPNVVLAMFKDGKQTKWKGLPEVWEHVGDKAAFTSFVQNSLRAFLGEPQAASPEKANPTPVRDMPPLPVPSPNPNRPSDVPPVPNDPTTPREKANPIPVRDMPPLPVPSPNPIRSSDVPPVPNDPITPPTRPDVLPLPSPPIPGK